jgi:hypothetical protein
MTGRKQWIDNAIGVVVTAFAAVVFGGPFLLVLLSPVLAWQ